MLLLLIAAVSVPASNGPDASRPPASADLSAAVRAAKAGQTARQLQKRLDDAAKGLDEDAERGNQDLDKLLMKFDDLIAFMDGHIAKMVADGITESDQQMINARKNLAILAQNRKLIAASKYRKLRDMP